jgi:DNA-directed RNA polymerase specialized sigma24 family protein/ribosome-associated translation inhibitor RaiA
MNVHISYKVPKTPDLEQEFNSNIEKLARRLQVFRPELVHLHAVVEENSPRQGFCLSLNLRLPSGQMAARESAEMAAACIRKAFDDLIEELTRHKDRLRSEHKWLRRHRMGRGVTGVAMNPGRPQQVPFEETLAAAPAPTVTDRDIETYINANLKRLDHFVERELRYRRNAGLSRDAVSKEEVIDEVVAAALGDEVEKPQVLGLEPWLYRLALRAIDTIAGGNRDNVPTVSLDASARKQNVQASDESELQFHQPDEMFTGRDVIADSRVSTPEQIASSDEMINHVEAALLGADRQDRDAFILFAVEGFTSQEIAAISDRLETDVRASIQRARERLQDTVTMPNEFKHKLLQHSRIA